MFDFNKLCELYRLNNFDKARIMLYENINVLAKRCWYIINPDQLEDTLWDLLLHMDEWINVSLNKWYQNKEVYWFLKLKSRLTLINKKNRWDKTEEIIEASYDIDLQETVSNDEWNMKDYLEQYAIRKFIFELDDPHRTVLILRYLSDYSYSLENISKQIERNLFETRLIHQEWLDKVKWFLYGNYKVDEEVVIHESQCD